MQVINAEGDPLPPTQPVGTGCVVEVLSEDGLILNSVTIVVKGDVLGTGELDVAQIVRMAQALNRSEPLTGVFLDAGKLTTGGGGINIADLVELAHMIVNSNS